MYAVRVMATLIVLSMYFINAAAHAKENSPYVLIGAPNEEQTLTQNTHERELERFLKNVTFDIFVDTYGNYGCRGFNIGRSKGGVNAWMSAGHCAHARYAKLSENHYVMTPLYSSVDNPPDDFLISTKPAFESDDAPHVVLNSRLELTIGEIYYTLGIYEWSPTRDTCLTMLQYVGIDTDGYLSFERAWGCNLPNGTSGSPIIRSKKELVGVYHGFTKGNMASRYPTLYYGSDPYVGLHSLGALLLDYLHIDMQ